MIAEIVLTISSLRFGVLPSACCRGTVVLCGDGGDQKAPTPEVSGEEDIEARSGPLRAARRCVWHRRRVDRGMVAEWCQAEIWAARVERDQRGPFNSYESV